LLTKQQKTLGGYFILPHPVYATKGRTIIILAFLSQKSVILKATKMAVCVSAHYAVLWLQTLHLTTTATTTTIWSCAGNHNHGTDLVLVLHLLHHLLHLDPLWPPKVLQ